MSESVSWNASFTGLCRLMISQMQLIYAHPVYTANFAYPKIYITTVHSRSPDLGGLVFVRLSYKF